MQLILRHHSGSTKISTRPHDYSVRLERLELLERLERCLFNSSLQKPSASQPVIIEPQNIAAAGFGVIVFALDFFAPPAAGENIGPGKPVDGAVLGT